MRTSSTNKCFICVIAMAVLCIAAAAAVAAEPNLLVNGGFERNTGVGTVPVGWDVDDELSDALGPSLGWIAPRIERQIGAVLPRSGRFMAGLDSEQMGIDSNGQDNDTTRAALRQTVTVPGGTRGEFQVFYNDLESTGLAYISVIRLAYTIDATDVRAINMGSKESAAGTVASTETRAEPGVWSKPFHRVSQQLSRSHHSTGDWMPASIPIRILPGNAVKLTVWIGIFDNQDGTEVGYWRIDDASLHLRPTATTTTRPASSQSAQ